jgi:hypothetical protein
MRRGRHGGMENRFNHSKWLAFIELWIPIGAEYWKKW